MSGARQQAVARDEDGMRLDRWFGVHFPEVTFGHLQKLIRTGQVRIDSGRAKTNSRLAAGQLVRVPPLEAEVRRIEQKISAEDAAFLRALILYEDDELYVFNKPHGLASQGGSGTKRHMDGLLKSLPNKQGEAPRLVHRLDRDTSGVLVVAKTRAAASACPSRRRAAFRASSPSRSWATTSRWWWSSRTIPVRSTPRRITRSPTARRGGSRG